MQSRPSQAAKSLTLDQSIAFVLLVSQLIPSRLIRPLQLLSLGFPNGVLHDTARLLLPGLRELMCLSLGANEASGKCLDISFSDQLACLLVKAFLGNEIGNAHGTVHIWQCSILGFDFEIQLLPQIKKHKAKPQPRSEPNNS
jgi:hypothetical protein